MPRHANSAAAISLAVFETLESRRLLSAHGLGVDSHHRLLVNGTGKADSITISLKHNDANTYLVNVNGAVTEVPASAVTGGIRIRGGSGNDLITVDHSNGRFAGPLTINGGKGHDTITGGDGDDSIQGGSGNDLIDGGAGSNSIKGGSGNDTITTGAGDDNIQGGSGNDVITSGGGDDYITGGSGNDLIDAGDGNDSAQGGSGNDTIIGAGGNDLLDGGAGDDSILGGDGDDTLFGGGGHDTLDGGAGNNTSNAAANHAPKFVTKPSKSLRLGSTAVQNADLRTWTVHSLDYTTSINCQPVWNIAADGVSAQQIANGNASFLMGSFEASDTRVSGKLMVRDNGRYSRGVVDNDFIGLVFGYQDDSHFYLFDWRRGRQAYWGARSQSGMTIKRISADSPLTVADLWNTADVPGRVTTLMHNRIPWRNRFAYGFQLDSHPGHFTLTITRGLGVLARLNVNDTNYTCGKFGLYSYSQAQAHFSAVTVQNLPTYHYFAHAEDADNDTLTYSLLRAPAGMTIDSATGEVMWSPTSAQLGRSPVTIAASDGHGGMATQSFVIAVKA